MSVSLISMAILTALVAFVVDRVDALKSRSFIIGVGFGLLGIIANCFSEWIPDGKVMLALRDAPPVVAGLYFGPVSAIVAGAIAAGYRALMPLWGGASATMCPLATMAVAVFIAAMYKWVFEGKRPAVTIAVMTAFVAEIIHLGLDSFFGIDDLNRVLQIVYNAFIPESVGMIVAAGLGAFACGSWKGWRRNFASSLPLAMGLSLFAFVLVAAALFFNAMNGVRGTISQTFQSFQNDVNDQISHTLHRTALALVGRFDNPFNWEHDRLVKLTKEYDIDEITLFNAEGYISSTSDAYAVDDIHKQNLKDFPVLRPYEKLLSREITFYDEEFRQSVINTNVYMRYVAVPLKEGKGILQMGYSWQRFKDEFSKFFFPALDSWRFGDTGFTVVFDKSANIIAAPVAGHPELFGRPIAEIGIEVKKLPPFDDMHDLPTLIYAEILGAKSLCCVYDVVEPWRLIGVVPLYEEHGPALIIAFGAAFLMLIGLGVFRLVLLRLRSAQEKIDALRAIEEAHRAEDSAMAKIIQFSSLRHDNPSTQDFAIYAETSPAREVGGDFYDYYQLPDGRLVITIADVSGKGVPAALFMMRARTALRASIHQYDGDLSFAIMDTNRQLCENNDAQMFVTVWVGVFEVTTGKLTYVNAGHNAPIIRRESGEVEWINNPSRPALAVFDIAKYQQESVRLKRGDALLLYTDGITEAMNARGELYGDRRLAESLQGAKVSFAQSVVEDLNRFVAGAEQSDDITLLTLDYLKG